MKVYLKSQFRKLTAILTLVFWIGNSVCPINLANAQNLLSPSLEIPTIFTPVTIKGLQIYPQDPSRFSFILDTGNTNLNDDELRQESEKLIQYFLAALTIPENNIWVNLNPKESNRIIAPDFETTLMGQDLLKMDLELKKEAASLLFQKSEEGKAKQEDGSNSGENILSTTSSPFSLHSSDLLSRIWIVPDKALVYEDGDRVFVADSWLKVKMEDDLMSVGRMNNEVGSKNEDASSFSLHPSSFNMSFINTINTSVNTNRQFSNLRQIYNAVILATWFKQNLKQSWLGQIYVDQHKTIGLSKGDDDYKNKIYQQYLASFQAGIKDYLKEEYNPQTQAIESKRYVVGGAEVNPLSAGVYSQTTDFSKVASVTGRPVQVDIRIGGVAEKSQLPSKSQPNIDKAMTADENLKNEKSKNIADAAVYLSGLKAEFPVRLEVPKDIVAAGLKEETIKDLLRIAGWEKDAPKTRIDERSKIFNLPPEQRFKIWGVEIKALQLVHVTNNGKKPSADILNPAKQKQRSDQPTLMITKEMVDGEEEIGSQEVPERLKDTEFLSRIKDEYQVRRQAFRRGVPVFLPVGVGEYTSIKLRNKKDSAGFIVLALPFSHEKEKPGSGFEIKTDRFMGKTVMHKSVLKDLNTFYKASARTLRKFHSAGFTHSYSRVENFLMPLPNEEAYLDGLNFSTPIDGKEKMSREQFQYRAMRDLFKIMVDIMTATMLELRADEFRDYLFKNGISPSPIQEATLSYFEKEISGKNGEKFRKDLLGNVNEVQVIQFISVLDTLLKSGEKFNLKTLLQATSERSSFGRFILNELGIVYDEYSQHPPESKDITSFIVVKARPPVVAVEPKLKVRPSGSTEHIIYKPETPISAPESAPAKVEKSASVAELVKPIQEPVKPVVTEPVKAVEIASTAPAPKPVYIRDVVHLKDKFWVGSDQRGKLKELVEEPLLLAVQHLFDAKIWVVGASANKRDIKRGFAYINIIYRTLSLENKKIADLLPELQKIRFGRNKWVGQVQLRIPLNPNSTVEEVSQKAMDLVRQFKPQPKFVMDEYWEFEKPKEIKKEIPAPEESEKSSAPVEAIATPDGKNPAQVTELDVKPLTTGRVVTAKSSANMVTVGRETVVVSPNARRNETVKVKIVPVPDIEMSEPQLHEDNAYAKAIKAVLEAPGTSEASIKRRRALAAIGDELQDEIRKYFNDNTLKISIFPFGSTLKGYATDESTIAFGVNIFGKLDEQPGARKGQLRSQDASRFFELADGFLGRYGFSIDTDILKDPKILVIDPDNSQVLKPEREADKLVMRFYPVAYGDRDVVEKSRNIIVQSVNVLNNKDSVWLNIQHYFNLTISISDSKLRDSSSGLKRTFFRDQDVETDPDSIIQQWRIPRRLPSLRQLVEALKIAPAPEAEPVDSAILGQKDDLGGIDLNPATIKLLKKGKAVQYDPDALRKIPFNQIQGVTPIIIKIQTIPNWSKFLSRETKNPVTQVSLSQ